MRTRLIAVFVVLSALGLIVGVRLGAFETDAKRVIPLNTVYVSFLQEGLKPVEEAAKNEDLLEAANCVREASPQIALCVGKDIAAAVQNSSASFAMPTELIPAVMAKPDETVWVAAYLGSDGSVPPAYRIQSVEVKNRTIRIAYERVESATRSSDLRAYMVWAPIGLLEGGVYTLQLADVSEGVTSTRSWQVTVN